MLQGEDINEFLREQARLYGEPDDDFTDFNEALLEQANKRLMIDYIHTMVVMMSLSIERRLISTLQWLLLKWSEMNCCSDLPFVHPIRQLPFAQPWLGRFLTLK